MDGLKTIRKSVFFQPTIIARIRDISEELNTNFSEFVREATEERLERIEQERLEMELAEGYRVKAKLNLKICEDFKFVDGENI